MIGRLFRAHGEFCASHPWEVIVALLTVTACIITLDKGASTTNENETETSFNRLRQCQDFTQSCEDFEADYNAADVIFMTILRCTAVLYTYYQFCKLQKLGSKYILGIASFFTVFTSFLFTTTIIKVLGSNVSDLKDALFFMLLVIDLSNSGTLAQLALSGTNQAEVTDNIAKGMELLGPTISLNTIVGTLLIGIGTLSGVRRLEILCTFGVMSVIVNYIVFMTFYPACLSLILDLSRNGMDISLVRSKAKDSIMLKALSDEEQKANPVVQRVKIIMTTGLMIVHIYSRAIFSSNEYSTVDQSFVPNLHLLNHSNKTEPLEISEYIIKWLTMSADQIVILILFIALIVKFIFFGNSESFHNQLIKSSMVNIPKLMDETIFDSTKEENQLFKERIYFHATTQTDIIQKIARKSVIKIQLDQNKQPRSIQECLQIINKEKDGAQLLIDEEIIALVNGNYYPLHNIENFVGDFERGVRIRRKIICEKANVPNEKFDQLPFQSFDYEKVMNACCENVLGYVPIPVGYAGPLLLDGQRYIIPMATTEGALVASTNRGCKALSIRGVTSFVEDIGMTRAPCVKFPSVSRAAEAKIWINEESNYLKIKNEFDSTSRFGRLKELLVAMDGPQLYIRFVALTGDAMGMNMVSKGTEIALRCIKRQFPDMQIISLSGNFCCDKKPAAINWIKGRGKRVVTECIIPASTLSSILKTDAKTLVECNKLKNMSGTAMAGSIGGNNAHAANMVTAVFLATGQDPAQNVTSSNCSTGMECWGDSNTDLYLTCTMPSLEVGTVGGGTGLPGQGACLDLLGVRGANLKSPGENAKKLARIVCATVMAGELSLMAALVNSELVKSHMRHNRSSVATMEKPKIV